MNTNKKVEEEEKGFDKQYTIGGEWWKEGMEITPSMIKSFISSLLSLQKICTLEEVEETMPKRMTLAQLQGSRDFALGYNEALSDLLAKLTSLKQDSGEIKK